MKWLSQIRRRFAPLFHRASFDRDLEEEMRSHLEMQAEEYRTNGMSPEEARRAARRQFGNTTLLKETSREQWGWAAVEGFARDLVYGWRALRRAPGFTAVALMTLALGVGANTAMFSVLRAVILRPLPYQDPDRLAMVWQFQERISDESQHARPRRRTPMVHALVRWRAHCDSFKSLAGYSGNYVNLTGGGDAERVVALVVTADFFPTLGAVPALGRNFLPEKERQGARTVILSDELWRTRFAADSGVLGETVSLDGAPHTVVGVLPAGFRPLLPTVSKHFDLYLPLALEAKGTRPPPVRVIGRLRKGVMLSAAQSEMEALAAGLRFDGPPGHRISGVQVARLADEVTGDAQPALLVLAGAVACVLLIVCVNLASMMLARGAARRREMGIRVALGAGRWSLARRLLAEALLLGVLGGAIGTVSARWIVDLIRTLHPGGLPRIEQAVPDAVVFAFGLVVSVVASLIFGALPAFVASRTRLDTALRQGGSRSIGGRGRLRAVLVGSEVALALVLATGAGLLLRSYVLLKAVEPGFVGDRVLTMQLRFSERTDSEARRGEFLEEVLERIRSLPTVESAGAVSSLPLAYEALIGTDVEVKGYPRDTVNTIGVTPGYFQTIGGSLVAGRFLREGDRDGVLVNEAFCKRYAFDTKRVVGEQITLSEKLRTVVGVVSDLRDLQLEKAAEPETFVPYPVLATPWAGLAVRTSSEPKTLLTAIRAEIRALDPNQAVGRVQTMDEILSREVARPRFHLMLLSVFAVMAVGLAALGVYGVIAYLVSQRRNEIGVRIALGAQGRAVIGYVLARGMIPVAAGVVVGVAGALAATRVLRGLLFGIGPTDPLTFVLSVLLLGAATLSACLLPAHRATKIDPTEALRYE